MAEVLLEQVASEAGREAEPGAHTAGPQALAMSADDFSALEERVLRAVALVKRERQARIAAEEHAARFEARLEQMEGEVAALRAERDAVRQRVERLLSQLDALEI